MTTRKRATKRAVELANLPSDLLGEPPLDVGGAPPFVPLSPTEERRERELEEILLELGSDARVKVSHVIEGKTVYAGDMSAEGFTLDAVLEAYGGGDKRLVFIQGRHAVERVTVSLDPTVPPRNPRGAKPLPPGMGGSNGSTDMLINIMSAMTAQTAQNASMMTQMMTGIIGGMTAMMTAQGNRDPIQSAVAIAEVMRPREAPGGSMADVLAVFREGMQIGRDATGKDEGDGVTEMVGKGLDTLSTIVTSMVEERRNARLHAGAAPGALPAPASESTPEAAGHGGSVLHSSHDSLVMATRPVVVAVPVRPWVDRARPFIGQLVMASKFMPPSAAADTILSHLTEPEQQDLLDDLEHDPAAFGKRLGEYFPEHIAQLNPQWIGEVMQAIYDSFDDSDESGGVPPSTPISANVNNGAPPTG